MRRLLIPLAAVLFVALALFGGTQAKFFQRGVQGPLPPPQFTSITMSCGSSCQFTSGTPGGVGTAIATLSSGNVTGTWDLKTSGTDSLGVTCHDYTVANNYLTINSSTGVISNTTGAPAQSYPGVCPRITQGSILNSPYSTAFTFTGNSSGVPALAQAGGFRTPVVTANFSQPAWGQSNFSNFLTNCGASSSTSGVPSSWHFTWGRLYGSPLGCTTNDLAIVSDGGTSVLRAKYNLVDFDGSALGGSLMFPTPYTAASGTWMPNNFYMKVVFRLDAVTATQTSSGQGAWTALWTTTVWGGGNPAGLGVDLNTFEQQDQTSGLQWWPSIWEWSAPGGTCDGGAANCVIGPIDNSFDATGYHTVEMLVTSDGSTDTWMCSVIDGNAVNGTNGCFDIGKFAFSANYARHDRMINFVDMIGTYNNTVAPPNPMTAYIKEVDLYSCSTFASGACTGTMVTQWP